MRTDVGLRCEACGQPAGAGRRRRLAGGRWLLAVGAACTIAAVAALVVSRSSGSDSKAGPAKASSSGSWTKGRSLGSIRGSTVAVVLRSGEVLVAGGGVGAVPVAAAELYEKGTGAWRATASMGEARRGHQAVVLPDGRVLVTGGVAGGRPLASAELYDPPRGAWTATAPMGTARLGHTLTLLGDGRVLAAGGTSLGEDASGTGQAVTPLASTEIYDPAAATWATGPAMAVARFEHTASLLADGRVLVAGGLAPAPGGTGPAPTAATEVYDPAARAFVLSSPLHEARTNHAAAELADHRIVVVGGSGGPLADAAIASAEVFDPTTGSWRPTGALNRARAGATAITLAGGGVLVAGGESVDRGVRRSLADAEVLDADGEAWNDAGRMACPRSEHAAVRLTDGRVMQVAGDGAFPGRPPVAQGCVDVYEPASGAPAKG